MGQSYTGWPTDVTLVECEGEAVEQTESSPVSSAGFSLIQTGTSAQQQAAATC